MTYMSNADRLVDALEGKNSISKVFLLALGINEGPLMGHELGRWIFAEHMIEES